MAIATFIRYGISCDECKKALIIQWGGQDNHIVDWGSQDSHIMESTSMEGIRTDAEDFDWIHLPDGRDICEDCVYDMVRDKKIVEREGKWVILP